jgi:hypothetical protein
MPTRVPTSAPSYLPTSIPTRRQKLTHAAKLSIGAVAGALFITFFALVFFNQSRRCAPQQKQESAGLVNVSKKLHVDDIMQKMPLDLVVQVAKDGRQQNMTFHTWDFGGQQVYYVLHHLFITEGVYCLVRRLQV